MTVSGMINVDMVIIRTPSIPTPLDTLQGYPCNILSPLIPAFLLA